MQKPACERCISRSLRCEYAPRDTQSTSGIDEQQGVCNKEAHCRYAEDVGSDETQTQAQTQVPDSTENPVQLPQRTNAPRSNWSSWRAPILAITEKRAQELLSDVPTTPSPDASLKRSMYLVISSLKSWARRMVSFHEDQLPPMIHRAQFVDGTPTSLSNCFTLVKLWSEHETGSRKLVQETIAQEVQRLIYEVCDALKTLSLGPACRIQTS